MARHGAVIQARMGSKRLPGKSMMSVGDLKLIDWVIRYTTSAFDPTDVVLATTTLDEDDLLVDHVANNWQIGIHRGSIENVLSRFVEVSNLYNFETVTRITADDPFKIPAHLIRSRDVLIEYELDYYCNFNPHIYPIGLDVESFRTSALIDSVQEASRMAIEHVTFDLRESPKYRRFFEKGENFWSSVRLTIDTPQDLNFCRKIASLLTPAGSQVTQWVELLNILENMSCEGINGFSNF
jgi:spore coat polysaccharide biosynthesis protein SpsF (cytidylyltransferase family)